MGYRVGVGYLLLALAVGSAAVAQGTGQPRAPVVPEAPADRGQDAQSSLERALALETEGKLEEAIEAYLDAVFPVPPEPGSWEAAVGIARLSDDPGQLGDALMASELFLGQPNVVVSIAQTALTAKLGRHEEMAILLNQVLGDMDIMGEPVPEPVPLLFEALIALSDKSPEAAAAAVIGLAEVDSPNAGVQGRGLDRIEAAVGRYPDEALTLRAFGAMASDDEGRTERTEELQDLLEQSAAPEEPGAQLARWVLEIDDSGAELEAELAALRERGVPLTLAEAAPKPAPDEENAAALYQKVFQVGFSPEERAAFDKTTAGPSLDELETAMGAISDYRMPASAAAREALTGPHGQEVLETLREASLRPHAVFPVHWEEGWAALFPHLSQYRAATRVLNVYVRMLAEDGRIDEALDWCAVALRMSEHAASEPILIGQLVGIAMRSVTFATMQDILSSAEVSAAQVGVLEEHLRGIDMYEAFRAAMVTELAGGSEIYELMRADPQRVLGMLGPGNEGQAALARLYHGRIARPLHSADQLAYLRHMQKLVGASELTYRDASAGVGAFDPTADELRRYPLASTIVPALDKAMLQRDYGVAQIGLCRVALALKAYKDEAKAYPETLSALKEGLEYPLPTDPFSGEDFVYETEGEGFVLYSLGKDMDDDGGATMNDEGQDGMNCDVVWKSVN